MRILVAATAIFIFACTNLNSRFTGAVQVRERLNQLENNQELAHRSPMAIEEASASVFEAEQPQKDPADSEYLLFIAERKVDIAEAETQRRLLEEQYTNLIERLNFLQLLNEESLEDN